MDSLDSTHYLVFTGNRVDNGEEISSSTLITMQEPDGSYEYYIPMRDTYCTVSEDSRHNTRLLGDIVLYHVDLDVRYEKRETEPDYEVN